MNSIQTQQDAPLTFEAADNFLVQQLRLENQWLRERLKRVNMRAYAPNRGTLKLQRQKCGCGLCN